MQLASLLLSVLAVTGGAAAGGVGAGLSTRLAGKFFRVRAPRPALIMMRLLGAGAGGLAVWLWVFGTGGGGWGAGGGSVFGGKGAGEGEKTFIATTKSRQAVPSATTTAASDTLRVIMLGGERVKDQRFYRIEGEAEPKTFVELKQDIKARQQAAKLKTIEIVVYEDSVARDHPTVRDLSDWAGQNGMAAILALRVGDAP
jgi:hypothetical protein